MSEAIPSPLAIVEFEGKRYLEGQDRFFWGPQGHSISIELLTEEELLELSLAALKVRAKQEKKARYYRYWVDDPQVIKTLDFIRHSLSRVMGR